MRFFSIIIASFLLLNAQASQLDKYRLITIGTGSITGLYYPVGGSICRILNKNIKESAIRCSVSSSDGSVENVESLLNHKNDFAILQFDTFYDAYNGTGSFSQKPANKNLRNILSLYQESLTILVKSDSPIKKFEDIKGKRITTAPGGLTKGSLVDKLFAFYGLDSKSFAESSEVELTEQPNNLCNNKTDVLIITAGHPNTTIKEAAISCDIDILPLSSDKVEDFLKLNPYYLHSTIKGGLYPGNPNDIKTIGVSAVLTTTSDMDSTVVYKLTKSILGNFENFKVLNPVFYYLNDKDMIDDNPDYMHEGTKQYLTEINNKTSNEDKSKINNTGKK